MRLSAILNEKKISTYQCSRQSNIPYTTLLELVKGKTSIEKCSAETVFRLAKALDMTMDELFDEYLIFRRDQTAAKPGTIRKDMSLWRRYCRAAVVIGRYVAGQGLRKGRLIAAYSLGELVHQRLDLIRL